jgi:hypothetical protein
MSMGETKQEQYSIGQCLLMIDAGYGAGHRTLRSVDDSEGDGDGEKGYSAEIACGSAI